MNPTPAKTTLLIGGMLKPNNAGFLRKLFRRRRGFALRPRRRRRGFTTKPAIGYAFLRIRRVVLRRRAFAFLPRLRVDRFLAAIFFPFFARLSSAIPKWGFSKNGSPSK
jgi:hypothetical protein